jgi:hypothetical protein
VPAVPPTCLTIRSDFVHAVRTSFAISGQTSLETKRERVGKFMPYFFNVPVTYRDSHVKSGLGTEIDRGEGMDEGRGHDRRQLLKIFTIGGVATAVILPSRWTKPIARTVIVPAHAKASPHKPNHTTERPRTTTRRPRTTAHPTTSRPTTSQPTTTEITAPTTTVISTPAPTTTDIIVK